MKETIKKIGDFNVKLKSWAFLKMMDRKKRILKLLGANVESIMSLIDQKEDSDGLSEIIDLIKSVLETLDDVTMTWLYECIFENVSIDGDDLSNVENQDKYLSGNCTLFYDIIVAVMEVNYGDFFQRLREKLTSRPTHLESTTAGA